MKGVIDAMLQQSPDFYSEETFFVRYKGNKEFYVRSNSGVHATACTIKGNKIWALAGGLPGDSAYANQLNDFLTYPLPNKKYIVDNGCFVYDTDAEGRVYKAFGDRSRADRELQRNRNRYNYSKYVQSCGYDSGVYDGGHIFANETKGPTEYINIVPMEHKCQANGEWRKFEGKEKELIDSGRQVFSERELLYRGRSKCPYAIKVKVLVDGKEVPELCKIMEMPTPK